MKKAFLNKVMMMAMMAVCVTVFFACGGDSDDPLDNPNPVAQDGDSNSDGGTQTGTKNLYYFEPLVDWTADKEKIKQYMSQRDMVMLDGKGDRDNALIYNYSAYQHPGLYSFQVMYYLEDGKLDNINIWYGAAGEENFQYLISETERIYGVKLELVRSVSGYDTYISGKEGGKYIEFSTSPNFANVRFYKNIPNNSYWN